MFFLSIFVLGESRAQKQTFCAKVLRIFLIEFVLWRYFHVSRKISQKEKLESRKWSWHEDGRLVKTRPILPHQSFSSVHCPNSSQSDNVSITFSDCNSTGAKQTMKWSTCEASLHTYLGFVSQCCVVQSSENGFPQSKYFQADTLIQYQPIA